MIRLPPISTRTDKLFPYTTLFRSSLRYDLSDTQSVRVAYSYDRARHRQTGRIGLLQANGNPFDVFPINDPVIAADGFAPSKRDRLSYAILHQVRSEERRVGKECVSTCRSRWSPYH